MSFTPLDPEVRIIAVWRARSEELLGYAPCIFGQDIFKRRFAWNTNLLPALDHIDLHLEEGDKVYATPEEAQAAWESATPLPLPGPVAGKYAVPADTVTAINNLKLYRTIPHDEPAE